MAESSEHDVNRGVVLRRARRCVVSMSWMALRFSKTLLRGFTFYIYITNLVRFLQMSTGFHCLVLGARVCPCVLWVSVQRCRCIACVYRSAFHVLICIIFKCVFDCHTFSVNIPSCSASIR